ncbi:MAG: hypothetical protein J3Q66DRAFT_193071 [Benniella sp.]|nr:MAG: hypothetical protein J3Q66DRAFT_193071 [Benniella sp.]
MASQRNPAQNTRSSSRRLRGEASSSQEGAPHGRSASPAPGPSGAFHPYRSLLGRSPSRRSRSPSSTVTEVDPQVTAVQEALFQAQDQAQAAGQPLPRVLSSGLDLLYGLGGESETQSARRRELRRISDRLEQLYSAVLREGCTDAQQERYLQLIRILEASRLEIVRLFPDANLDTMARTFRRQLAIYDEYIKQKKDSARRQRQ